MERAAGRADSYAAAALYKELDSERMEDSARRVRLAIVSYDAAGFLRDLLASIRRALDVARGQVAAHVVVVDNAASRESAEVCARAPLAVELRRSTGNVGFGVAANQALAGASEPWLLVLNADLLLADDFFVAWASVLSEAESGVGIFGPGLRNEDGSLQPSVGRFPTLARTLTAQLQSRSNRKYVARRRHRRSEVDWVTGACLAIRRTCWERLGGFDPRFFLYYEDVDLCRRARAAGFRVRYEPALRVTHRNPFAQRELARTLVPVIRYSQLLYFRLHRPGPEFRALCGLTEAWAACQAWKRPKQNGGVDWGLVRELPLRVRRGERGPTIGSALQTGEPGA